jgi:hypothetical protein
MERPTAYWDLFDQYTRKPLESGRMVNDKREPVKGENLAGVGDYGLVTVVDFKQTGSEDGIPRYDVFVRIIARQDYW